MVGAHQVEAEVDAGGDPGRGEDVAVVDEEHVLVELDPREGPPELGAVHPVGGGGPAVEEAGCGEDLGAGAYRDDPGAGADAGEGVGEDLRQGLALEEPGHGMGGRNDHGVGRGEGLGAGGDADGEARIAGHGPAVGGADGDLVQAAPVLGARVPEDARRHAELERGDAFEGEDGNTAHGQILSHGGRPATTMRYRGRPS